MERGAVHTISTRMERGAVCIVSVRMERGAVCIVILQLLLAGSLHGGQFEFAALFTRVPGTQLTALPLSVLENVTVDACARACVQETEFECKSFDMETAERNCHLHNHSRGEPLIGLQESLYTDHYHTAYETLFSRIPNHVITMKHVRSIRGLVVEECARRCIMEMGFKCRGFDYERLHRNCWLTDKVAQDVGGLRRRSNTDYYGRKSHGPLSRFINYGYGSLQTLEGVQTHTKVVLGVSLDACAQLCLAETAFQCVSFDYVFGATSCELSEFIAANVHGMRTDFDSTYRVMHYELVDEYLEYFYPTPYASIVGNNERTFHKVTPDTCARKCLQEREFICRSFDYQIQYGTCLLSHVTGSDAGGLYTPDGVHVHHFEMKPSLDCGGMLAEESGSIASPNWPRHYNHHLNCSWTVTVSRWKVIRVDIHHLDLGQQTTDRCDRHNDRLDFSEELRGRRRRTCAENFLTEFASVTNVLTITFTTNAENDAPGFRLFYNSDWPCEATLTSDNGEFASPRWPNAYPAMTSCHWLIRAPATAEILLRVTSALLEDHTGSSCATAYDTVTLYDGNTTAAAPLHTFCGNSEPMSFSSSGNELYVEFISDSRVQATGFHAAYTFLYTTTTHVTTTQRPTTSTSGAPPTPTLGDDRAVNESSWVAQAQDVTSNMTYVASNMTYSASVFLYPLRDDTDRLEATFVEPIWDVATGNESASEHGVVGDDIGMGVRPKMAAEVPDSGREVRAMILGVLVSFLIMFIVVLISLFLVCRYYRRKLPKRRHGNNMSTSCGEENETLCDDKQGCPDPLPDVEFNNPMYDRTHGPRSRPLLIPLRLPFTDIEPDESTSSSNITNRSDALYTYALSDDTPMSVVTETADSPMSVVTVETLLVSEC